MSAPPVPPEVRRARIGVILLFFLNGVSWMSIVPRYPEIKASLALSDDMFGLIIALGPLGGLLTGFITAHLLRRFQSAPVASVTQAIGILMINVVVNAPAAWIFAIGLFVMACMDALCDTAMNSHGFRVQRRYGRSIVNSFHAWWSVGALSGGLIGAMFLQLQVPLWLQGAITSSIFVAASLYARTLLLPGPDPAIENVTADAAAPATFPWQWVPRLLALGIIGAAAGIPEDAGGNWSALYIDRYFDTEPFMLGMGLVALQLGMTISRFIGDRVVDAIGNQKTALLGGLITAGGMLAALLFPSVWLTLLGFFLAGGGVATTIPTAMQVGDELPGLRQGTGLTIVTVLIRGGFIVGPLITGFVSEQVELRWALLVVVACGLLVAALSPALTPVASHAAEDSSQQV